MNLPEIKAEFAALWAALRGGVGSAPEKLAVEIAQLRVGLDEVFRRTAGSGDPPDLASWLAANPEKDPAREFPAG